MKKIFIIVIRLYQKIISAYSYISCRYSPTCSNYSIEAINQHGIIVGLILLVKRLCKCVFFNKMAYDPVPSNKKTVSQLFIQMFHVKHLNKFKLGKE